MEIELTANWKSTQPARLVRGMPRGIEQKNNKTNKKKHLLFFFCVLYTFRKSDTVGQYVLETNLQNNNYVVTVVLLD